MSAAGVAATILRHLVPALEAARLELERKAADEAALGADARPRVFDISQAAEFLHTSTTTVRREMQSGRLPYKRLGERVYVLSERALLDWIDQRAG
ncbi:MAG: helix-turn-helix domain-containing protein [bacterium]|jgi:excisionase family DNA binding protein